MNQTNVKNSKHVSCFLYKLYVNREYIFLHLLTLSLPTSDLVCAPQSNFSSKIKNTIIPLEDLLLKKQNLEQS